MAKARRRTTVQDERSTRERWLREGLEILARLGEPAVKVDVIARKLKISRGSFYWHFVDRAEFLSALLEEWRREATTAIHEQLLRDVDLTPIERLGFLERLASSGYPEVPGGQIERALTQWASYNEKAAAMLLLVHEERLRFVEALFRGMGYRKPALAAEIFYGYLVGRNQLLAAGVPLDRSDHGSALFELLESAGPVRRPRR